MSVPRNVERTVSIDVLPQGLYRLAECDAIVVIDVVLAGTLVATALEQGRPTYLPASLEDASRLRPGIPSALFAQEGFDALAGYEALGPTGLRSGADSKKPLLLIVPWASELAEAGRRAVVYIASLRNIAATALVLAASHGRVGLLGAGYKGEPRSEDRIAAARLADALLRQGFRSDGMSTLQEIRSWARADMGLVSWGKSCDYLRRAGRDADVDFILDHQDDVNLACRYAPSGEVSGVRPADVRTPSGPVVVPYVPRAGAAADSEQSQGGDGTNVRRLGRTS
jgi:phosphosulfolactate phosphohydrolase-like enzyme